jgi:hypothetical protein
MTERERPFDRISGPAKTGLQNDYCWLGHTAPCQDGIFYCHAGDDPGFPPKDKRLRRHSQSNTFLRGFIGVTDYWFMRYDGSSFIPFDLWWLPNKLWREVQDIGR